MHNDCRKKFGHNLYRVRVKQGRTQQFVADVSEIQQASYSRIESGEGNPTLETISKLADALDVSPAAFFDEWQQ